MSKLTARQVRALEKLAAGARIAEAARAAHVSVSTVKRWLADDAFRAELDKLQTESLQILARRLAALGDAAAGALQDALDASQPVSTRLRAATVVFDRLVTVYEFADLARRVATLENALGVSNE